MRKQIDNTLNQRCDLRSLLAELHENVPVHEWDRFFIQETDGPRIALYKQITPHYQAAEKFYRWCFDSISREHLSPYYIGDSRLAYGVSYHELSHEPVNESASEGCFVRMLASAVLPVGVIKLQGPSARITQKVNDCCSADSLSDAVATVVHNAISEFHRLGTRIINWCDPALLHVTEYRASFGDSVRNLTLGEVLLYNSSYPREVPQHNDSA